ncbi:hypothetical protein KDK_67200 [Dictyobacter kobayashii]|uniref:Two-component sensor histidine kinase n=2 Tax=Dictyobacter kobayashii TaxID=2014872 RepID=A0A402AUW0_9CHLR|nr:hypothetical protein KDK_67200 [Dictyobacter kobayashii]
MIVADCVAAFMAVQIILTRLHSSLSQTIAIEFLFLTIILLLVISRALKQFLLIVAIYWMCLLLSLLLSLSFAGNWGYFGIYMTCSIAFYRFPLKWSLPLLSGCMLALILTNGSSHFLLSHQVKDLIPNAILLPIAIGVSWVSWTRRIEFLLINKLQATQQQLRAEMARSEALAAERERTRIARDIHDVLSHTLSILSIQVQAARQLATRDPNRLSAKLEDMAVLIRESIAESRRVVGLLREVPTTIDQDSLTLKLNSAATTFGERTGIHCLFAEEGTPPAHEALSTVQQETLQYALREMLTNANRHGHAQTIWITLRWRESALTLQVRDDGQGKQAQASDEPAHKTDNLHAYGHHGLRGMRERAVALGGEVEAGPLDKGGFSVTLRIPFIVTGLQKARGTV